MYFKKYTPEEALQEIKLRMKYSSSKTLNENLALIKEQPLITGFDTSQQSSNFKLNPSYDNEAILKLIVKGAIGSGGFGTDEVSLVTAMQNIKDGNHFNQINAEMAKNPKRFGNYSSIIKLLQGEMDMDDIKTAGNIKSILAKKGINLSITDKDGYYNPKQITVIDDSKPNPSPDPPPDPNPKPNPKPIYTYCKSFPFKQKCKNRLIAEFQVCLGLPKKHQTGNFGPITLKAMNERLVQLGKEKSSVITQEVYNTIISNCGSSNSNDDYVGRKEMVSLDRQPRPSTKIGNDLPTSIKSPQLSLPNISGEQLFNAYVNLKDLYKRDDDWVFKGDDMTRDNLDKVSEYLRTQGYRTLEKGDKRYGEKFVWKR